MLFKRYACPFDLMDEMIASCRFLDWICEFIQIQNEEETEKVQWEFFLHKVFDMTYQDYLDACTLNQNRQKDDENFDFGATFEESKSMLEGFVPE